MIPQNSPVIDGNERKYVLDCIDTNWISSMGDYITAFEDRFSAACGCRHGVACSSGTSALHIALECLGVGPGDEVIVPDFTLIADSNMVLLSGATPIFVDVDPDNWCLSPQALEAAITPRTKTIIAVHMYGHPCDMDAIGAVARKHGLKIVEDAAQAHGTYYKSKPAGALSDIACFSFYASKTLTTGEGGMLTTNDPALAEKARMIRSQGFVGNGRTYVHEVMGYNYRMTNLQAAIGLAQTELLESKVERKRAMARLYRSLLEETPGLAFQKEAEWADSAYWNFVVLFDRDFGMTRDEVADRLVEKGIQTRLTFKPLHSQPVYKTGGCARFTAGAGDYPVSERLGGLGLCLPSGLALTDDEISYVCASLTALRK